VKQFQVILVGLVVLLIIVACAAPAATLTPGPTATSSGPTVGQLAQQGQAIYANACARCHGDKGQGGSGPTLIGAQTVLSGFGNAQALLDWVKGSHPRAIAGSLKAEEFLQVIVYLLQQNNVLSPSAALNSNALASISLKK
jgi:mono/diheme cytochrome c family protein